MNSLDANNSAGFRELAHRTDVAAMLAIALVLTGCNLPQWAHNGFKVGPNYAKPVAGIADDWIDDNDPRILDQPPNYADWWSVYQDPALDELVQTAYQQNLTLREAGTRVLQARAQRAFFAGTLLPQAQFVDGAYSRDQISITGQPLLAPLPDFRRSFDTWFLSGNLSWELDFWGRYRRAIESADARLDASVEEYDAILVSLIAEVATAYLDIRTFQLRLKYARENVRSQEGSFALAQTRAREGKTGEIGVHLSKSNLDATRALIEPLEIGLRLANNRLCTLLGQPTTDLLPLLGEGNGIPSAPNEIAVGIPADLLRRRPDVRAAERGVAAQNAQIGVALADLYPSIAITGEISVRAEEFDDLFKSLSSGGAIGPGFRWNVLNYGRILNNVRVQEARLWESIARYQNTVLRANEEVENALVSFLRIQGQVTLLAASAQEAQRALELELLNFKEGEADFSGVFVLQGDLTAKQDRLAAAQGRLATSLVAVFKALGGGWEIRRPDFRPRDTDRDDDRVDGTQLLPVPEPGPLPHDRDGQRREDSPQTNPS